MQIEVCSQVYTYTPMAKLNRVEVLFSMAENLDWSIQQPDFKNAFLNIDTKV